MKTGKDFIKTSLKSKRGIIFILFAFAAKLFRKKVIIYTSSFTKDSKVLADS